MLRASRPAGWWARANVNQRKSAVATSKVDPPNGHTEFVTPTPLRIGGARNSSRLSHFHSRSVGRWSRKRLGQQPTNTSSTSKVFCHFVFHERLPSFAHMRVEFSTPGHSFCATLSVVDGYVCLSIATKATYVVCLLQWPCCVTFHCVVMQDVKIYIHRSVGPPTHVEAYK